MIKKLFVFIILFSFISCNFDEPTNKVVTKDTTINIVDLPTDTIETLSKEDIIEFGPECQKCFWPKTKGIAEKNINNLYPLTIIARGCNCCKFTYQEVPNVEQFALDQEMKKFIKKIEKYNLESGTNDCDPAVVKYKIYFGTVNQEN